MTIAQRIQAVVGGLVIFLVTYTLAERANEAEASASGSVLELEVVRAQRDAYRRAWQDEVDAPRGGPATFIVAALAGLLVGIGIALVIGL